jgi:hypothetical protein
MSAETTDDATETTEHKERPPFSDGNLARLKMGHRSPRVYGAVAEKILEDLLEAKPDLASYPEEVAAVAQQEAITALLRIEMAGGVRDRSTGEVRLSLLARYFAAERAAAKARDRVGLAPLSEAVIARERTEAIAAAVDLHALAARGQAALEARASEHGHEQEPDLVIATVEQLRDEYQAERAAAAVAWGERRTAASRTGTPTPDLPPSLSRPLTRGQNEQESTP